MKPSASSSTTATTKKIQRRRFNPWRSTTLMLLLLMLLPVLSSPPLFIHALGATNVFAFVRRRCEDMSDRIQELLAGEDDRRRAFFPNGPYPESMTLSRTVDAGYHRRRRRRRRSAASSSSSSYPSSIVLDVSRAAATSSKSTRPPHVHRLTEEDLLILSFAGM